MPPAPHRGERKCGTCLLYTDKQDDWNAGCKLDMCKCRAAGKEFGIALCPNYKSQVYIDRSNHGDIDGPITGYCEWKCPPILRKVLWGHFDNRFVNADTSWCHCWEKRPAVATIDDQKTIDIEPTKQLR